MQAFVPGRHRAVTLRASAVSNEDEDENDAMTFLRAIIIPAIGACALAFLLALPAAPSARAELVTTDRVMEYSGPAEARDAVRGFLLRQDVQAQMEALGVDPEEARARVSALSDEELAAIAGHLDALPAGQDVSTNLLLLLLIIVVLILLL